MWRLLKVIQDEYPDKNVVHVKSMMIPTLEEDSIYSAVKHSFTWTLSQKTGANLAIDNCRVVTPKEAYMIRLLYDPKVVTEEWEKIERSLSEEENSTT